MNRIMKVCMPLVTAAICTLAICPCEAGKNVFRVRGDQLCLNDKPFKIIGLRCSNALMTDESTKDLIDHLDFYRKQGINTVGVYLMGSRYGDIKGIDLTRVRSSGGFYDHDRLQR